MTLSRTQIVTCAASFALAFALGLHPHLVVMAGYAIGHMIDQAVDRATEMIQPSTCPWRTECI